MSESIAQKLIEEMEKCCSAHALFAIVPGEEAMTEAARKSQTQQEVFAQLALEVEEDEEERRQYIRQINAGYERQAKEIESYKKRESLWRELDICYQEIMNVNYSGVSTRKIIKELRAQLGLREE